MRLSLFARAGVVPRATSALSTRIAYPQARRINQETSRRLEGTPEEHPEGTSTKAEAQHIADNPTLGKTGGGDPLTSTAPNAPGKPKVDSFALSGSDNKLTDEQQKEVDEHNKEFEKKHDLGNRAPGDKVHKEFWAAQSHGEKRAEGDEKN